MGVACRVAQVSGSATAVLNGNLLVTVTLTNTHSMFVFLDGVAFDIVLGGGSSGWSGACLSAVIEGSELDASFCNVIEARRDRRIHKHIYLSI